MPPEEYLAQLPRKRVITSALIVADDQRVLCVEPTYKPTWHLPGGTVEQGESPRKACARECREELGVSVVVGPLVAVQHIAPQGHDPHGALAFVYGCSLQSRDIVLAADEIRSVAWLAEAERKQRLSDLARGFVDAGFEGLRRETVVDIDEAPRLGRTRHTS